MIDHKEILKRLPGSWQEMKLKDYMKTVDVEISDEDGIMNIFNGATNTLKVIAAIADVRLEDLEELPLSQLAELSHKIEFIQDTLPEDKSASTIQWKSVEEISYSDFVLYSNLSKEDNGLIRYLPNIIQAYSKNKMTMDEVLSLPMPEVWGGFFTLEKNTKKFVRRTATSLKLKLLRQKMGEMLTRFKLKLTGRSN